VDIDSIVRFNQRNVANYQYRINGPNVWLNLAPDEDDLSRITSLHLCIQYETHCKHAAHLLNSVRSLVSLDILFIGYRAQLFETLVLLTRFGPHKPKFLRVEGTNFSDGMITLKQLVEVEKLEELQLIGCQDYSRLLRDLKKLALGLKVFCIHEYDMGEQDFEIDSNDFLRSLDSLECVSLTLDPNFESQSPFIVLDWSALTACASKLKYLRVEYQSIKSPFLCKTSAHNFSVFCEHAINLEQLAISGIEIGADVCGGATSRDESEDASQDSKFKSIFHFLVSRVAKLFSTPYPHANGFTRTVSLPCIR